MTLIFNIAQIVLAILLGSAILLQQKGSGLGSAFGGESNVYQTRRGAEKILFRATIVLAILFLGVAVARLLIRT
jgi:protein translocase SecG subunit